MPQRPTGTPLSPRPRGTVRRRIVSAFTERLKLKGAAIFFAGLLWLIVSAEEPADALVEVQFEPVITDSTVRVREPLPVITALVEGPRRELWRLRTYPPVVRRVIGPDSPEQLTLRLVPSDIILNGASGVKPIEVSPRAVTVNVDVARSRMVPVVPAFALVPDSGIVIAGPARLTPDSVRIQGSRARIAAVDSVLTLPRPLMVRDTAPIPVALDTAGLGVIVRPARVTVTVPAAAAAPDSARADSAAGVSTAGDSAATPAGAPARRPRS